MINVRSYQNGIVHTRLTLSHFFLLCFGHSTDLVYLSGLFCPCRVTTFLLENAGHY